MRNDNFKGLAKAAMKRISTFLLLTPHHPAIWLDNPSIFYADKKQNKWVGKWTYD